ncbi:MAG: ATP synthase subunit I, partial [Edaphobacter sp.]
QGEVMILLAFALLAGICIGMMFFAGLWWTVQRAITSRQPGILFAGSFVLRTALALGGFYLVGNGSWPRMASCLVGFIVGRILVKRVIQQDHLGIEAQPQNREAR